MLTSGSTLARPLVGSIANAGDPYFVHGWWRDEMGRRSHGKRPCAGRARDVDARAGRGIDTERRLLKRRERAMVAHDVAHQLAAVGPEDVEPGGYDLDSAWVELMNSADDIRELLDGPAGCSCRRCLLHDDFGGCVADEDAWEADLMVEHGLRADASYDDLAAVAGTGAVARLGAYDLNEDDLPGWSAARVDFTEFSGGFKVTARP